MNGRFELKVARIESVSDGKADSFAQITFCIDNGMGRFYLPVLVNKNEFDDADLISVARSVVHQTFVELSNRTEGWKLTQHELQQLSSLKLRQSA